MFPRYLTCRYASKPEAQLQGLELILVGSEKPHWQLLLIPKQETCQSKYDDRGSDESANQLNRRTFVDLI